MRRVRIVTLSLAALAIELACSTKMADTPKALSPEAPSGAPIVEITVEPTMRLERHLRFKWRLTNPSSRPAFVFATLFDPIHRAFVEYQIYSKQRIIQVGFLRSDIAGGLPPYSFPKIEFKELGPQEVFEGYFESDEAIEMLEFYELDDNQLRRIKIDPGKWTIRAAVAWGTEVDSVKQAIHDSARKGQEHPMNAVVRWQTLVFSDPITVSVVR